MKLFGRAPSAGEDRSHPAAGLPGALSCSAGGYVCSDLKSVKSVIHQEKLKGDNTMTTSEAIRHRRSVRTFDDNTLNAEILEQLLNFARAQTNPYDIPISWFLLDAAKHGLRSPVITGEHTYMTGKLKKVPHGEEAFGYSFEAVLLYAETLGLGSTWIAGTMNRGAFERAVSLQEGEAMPCVSPIGFPASKMSLRETLMRKGVRADSRMDFRALFFRDDWNTPLSEQEAGALRGPLEMVHLAPSAVNKQPWRVLVQGDKIVFFEKRSKGYVGADGWDLQKVDLGIALAHFDLAAREAGLMPSFTPAESRDLNEDGLVEIGTFVCINPDRQ